MRRERWRRRQQLELAAAVEPEPARWFGRRVRQEKARARRAVAGLLAVLTALAAQRVSAATFHVVQPGETLSGIAARYGVPVRELAKVNRIADPDVIWAGSRLVIPEPERVSARIHRVQPGETLSAIAQRYGVSVAALVAANDLADPNRILVGQTLVIPEQGDTAQMDERVGRYVVQPGDTLVALAARFGVPLRDLAAANGLSDPNRILAGQVLTIPHRGTGPVRLEGVPAYRQSLSLSCEAAALSMVTAYWGRPISEWVFIENMPRHPNPHRGFRGDMHGQFGGTDDYGIYAEPLVPLLQRYGFQAEVVYAQGDTELLKSELRAGRPVIVWMTNMASVQPQLIEEFEGEQFVLVPQEHAVVVYGYDEERVYVADPGDGQYRAFAWEDFVRSWGYFDGMMLRIQPAPWG
ncbi:MAG: LysM peptidoglycan-binding domain-containing protein [Thermomicrobium sp.]